MKMCLLLSLKGILVLCILITCISCRKLYVDLSKLLRPGIDRLAKFYLNKAIVKGELIKLYLLNILVRVLLLLKSMWTTLSSVDLLRP